MGEHHDENPGDGEQQPQKEYKLNKFGFLPLEDQVQAPIVKVFRVISKFVDGPVDWFRVNIVEKYRGPAYPYYHRKFKPVTPISECYTDDLVCVYEADRQYIRERHVDEEIIKILRQRYYRCSFYERAINEWHDLDTICQKEKKDMQDATYNRFIKYGELGPYQNVIDAFMKQKHRMIMERRQSLEANQGSS